LLTLSFAVLSGGFTSQVAARSMNAARTNTTSGVHYVIRPKPSDINILRFYSDVEPPLELPRIVLVRSFTSPQNSTLPDEDLRQIPSLLCPLK
jgi:hypothetical protein